MVPASCTALDISSAVASPFLGLAWPVQDHLRLELFQPLCVQLQRLHILVSEVRIFFKLSPSAVQRKLEHFVPATVIDSNANGPGELLAQTSSLTKDDLHQKIKKYFAPKKVS